MNSDPRDYLLDIRSQKLDLPDRATLEADDKGRPYLMVMFACCKVYQRVYKNTDQSQYEARCPKCLRSITFRIGDGGTAQRTFVVE
jgi:hypothetical protein